MFLRVKKTPNGQVTQLVHSYRNSAGKSRQYIVASLGDLVIPKAYRRLVASEVEDRLQKRRRRLPDMEPPEEVATFAEQIVRHVEREGRWPPPARACGVKARRRLARSQTTASRSLVHEAVEQEADAGKEKDEEGLVLDGVLADQVQHGQEAALGCVLAGWTIWRELEMDDCLKKLGFSGLDRAAAMALAINRLDEPASEHGMPQWLSVSALPDLVPSLNRVRTDDRFYRVGDKLYAHREAIEAHLCEKQQSSLRLRRTLILYDLTNTHFEGVCAANPKARRGKNKQKRDDCPQVSIGMLFDEHGFELGHKIFAGNRNDATTLSEMIDDMEKLAAREETRLLEGEAKPLVVMDAGLATKENLALLEERGLEYVVNETRTSRKAWTEIFAEEDRFEKMETRGGAELLVRKEVFKDPETQNEITRVFCKSGGRKAKELAIRTRAEDKLIDDVKRLAKRIENGRLKNPEKVQTAIGRIRQRNRRASRFYGIEYHPPERGETVGRLTWRREDENLKEEDTVLGGYVLRTPRAGLGAKTLWRVYTMLTVAEKGFRTVKGTLGLRPNYHELPHRVEAHIFISILAYHLLSHIQYRLRQAGDRREWKTLRAILNQHTYATITLPTRSGAIYHLRRSGEVNPQQQKIYDVLDIHPDALPSRPCSIRRP